MALKIKLCDDDSEQKSNSGSSLRPTARRASIPTVPPPFSRTQNLSSARRPAAENSSEPSPLPLKLKLVKVDDAAHTEKSNASAESSGLPELIPLGNNPGAGTPIPVSGQVAETEERYPVFAKGAKLDPLTRAEILRRISDGDFNGEVMLKVSGVWTPLSEMEWAAASLAASAPQPPVSSQRTQSVTPSMENWGGGTSSRREKELDERQISCPHCWNSFPMSQMLFISKYPEMGTDSVVPGAPMRFLPMRFNEQGYAIDDGGMVCQDMACPRCHLKIPEAVVDIPSSMFSLVGSPRSGKSYYLTAMIWQLRNILSSKFDYTFADTDVTLNSVLNEYEQMLFLNRQTSGCVSLAKTALQGTGFSNQISLGGMQVDLPLPFIFTMTPFPSNSRSSQPDGGLRNVVFYDNAGEHFQPGRDHVNNPATLHLSYSDSITFLFDPLQDIRMAELCDASDPQLQQPDTFGNQLVLLNEMISRIRKYSGIKSKEKYDRPLVVVIPKYDAWKSSFPIDLEQADFMYYNETDMNYYLNVGMITSVSYAMREALLRISPEVVATCESFFRTVYFLPVSALGQIPEYDAQKDAIGIKPQHLHPIWVEVPMLLQFWLNGLLPAVASGVSDTVPITQYRFAGDELIYSLPGGHDRKIVPEIYWGRAVYSEELKANILFPESPKEKIPPAAPTGEIAGDGRASSPGKEAASDEFWQE